MEEADEEGEFDEYEDGTVIYHEGFGNKRWWIQGKCVKCKERVESGEVRFVLSKGGLIHTRCGICPRCKSSLIGLDIDLEEEMVQCASCSAMVRLVM